MYSNERSAFPSFSVGWKAALDRLKIVGNLWWWWECWPFLLSGLGFQSWSIVIPRSLLRRWNDVVNLLGFDNRFYSTRLVYFSLDFSQWFYPVGRKEIIKIKNITRRPKIEWGWKINLEIKRHACWIANASSNRIGWHVRRPDGRNKETVAKSRHSLYKESTSYSSCSLYGHGHSTTLTRAGQFGTVLLLIDPRYSVIVRTSISAQVEYTFDALSLASTRTDDVRNAHIPIFLASR